MMSRIRGLGVCPVNLSLFDPVLAGHSPRGNITPYLLPTWRRSICSLGGYWIGSGTFQAPPSILEEFFENGLMREIEEAVAGLTTWRGFVAGMTLVRDGRAYHKTWNGLANAVKVIYARLGDNLLSNPSLEDAPWPAYHTPTTNERSLLWASEGAYSQHIIVDQVNDGAIIETEIRLSAYTGYDCRLSAKITSGVWKLEVYDMSTSDPLASCSALADPIPQFLTFSISPLSPFSGTAGLRLYCITTTGEIFADAAVFQRSAQRAETAWFQDTASQADYGRIEQILLEASMTPDAAAAKAQLHLTTHAWPYIDTGRLNENAGRPNENAGRPNGSPLLTLTVLGYSHTLGNMYSPITGTSSASDHVTRLASASQFVTPGQIENNPILSKIDERVPLRIGAILSQISRLGDLAGNRWSVGVYRNRELDYYQELSTSPFKLQHGLLYHYNGAAVEPWFARPGHADDLDAEWGSGSLSGEGRRIFINEVEFDAGEWLAGGSGLKLRRNS